MEKKLTITETLKQWKSGELDIKSLWYDWFCKETSLENRGKRLLQKLKAINNSRKFDSNKTYVIFNNNSPCDGYLYDNFWICDIDTENIIYDVTPASGLRGNYGYSDLWGRENNFSLPIIEGTWQEVKDWFLK